MSRRGIPASVERQEFLVKVAVAGITLALVAVVAIYWASRATQDTTSAYTAELALRDGAIDPVVEERERASAYRAIRDYMDQRDWGSDIVAVYCRDSAHQIVGDAFVFRGRIDLEQASGALAPMNYRVEIYGNSEEGWELRSVKAEPAGDYSESTSDWSFDSEAGAEGETAGPSARTPDAETP